MERLAKGEDIDIHQVMIAMEQASTALQLTLQVRNKMVDAYTEIMRTQI
jgi:flagellar hook-basal body complex protein FliE